jgi:hypothetical protein
MTVRLGGPAVLPWFRYLASRQSAAVDLALTRAGEIRLDLE